MQVIPIGISFPKEPSLKIDSERREIPRSRFVVRILKDSTYAGREAKKKDCDIETKTRQDSLDRRIGSLQSSESRRT